MQLNTDLFGQGLDVYYKGGNSSNPVRPVYKIASQNANLSAGYKSGAMPNNTDIDDSLFYWLIGKGSPYSRLSYIERTAATPYVYTIETTEERSEKIPIVMWAGQGFKINTSTYELDLQNGTNKQSSANNNVLQISQAQFKTSNTQQPLWETNNSMSSILYDNGAYASNMWLTEFDYNELILTIQVGTGDTPNTDLANYSNTSANKIYSIGYDAYIGNGETGYNRTSMRTNYVDENNTNMIAGGSTGYGGNIVTDAEYGTPKRCINNDWYVLPTFRKVAHLTSSTSITLFNGYNYTQPTQTANPCYYLDPDKWEQDANGRFYLKKSDTDNNIYTEDDFNYIRKLIAWLGFWFTDGGNYTDADHGYTIARSQCKLGENANDYSDEYMIPNHVFQAEIIRGTTTGNFTELRIAKDNDQSKWGKDFREKDGYNGRSTGRNDRGNLSTTLQRGTIAAGCKWYGLDATQLNALVTWINTGYQPASNDQFINDFKGTNPGDYITSITYMPCYPIPAGVDEQINIGPLSTSVQGRKISYEYGVLIDLGSYPLQREYYNFLDYKPYTAVSLYVPFCGTVELDAANYYGRTINVKLMVDMSTGSCTGLIFANDLLIDSISGQCGISIPLAAFEMGTYQNAIVNAQYQLKAAERQQQNAMLGLGVSMIGGTLTATTGIGLAAGIVGSIYSYNKMQSARDTIENIEYTIDHMQPKQTQISTGAPTNAMGFERDCRLIITRPADLIEDPDEYAARIAIYGHTVGYMTNKQGTLSEFHGFTQCSNADLSGIPLTSSEISAIHEALKKGVYLP